MQWSEAKMRFPNHWILIEAIDAISKDNYRIVRKLAVVDTFGLRIGVRAAI